MTTELQKIFNLGKKIAEEDGFIWDDLTGAERNIYYGEAERRLNPNAFTPPN